MPDTLTFDQRLRSQAFAALINGQRTALELTVEQVADQSGISRAQLSRYLAGQSSRPSPDHIQALARVLGLAPQELLVTLGYLTLDDLRVEFTAAVAPELSGERIDRLRTLLAPTVAGAVRPVETRSAA